MGSPRSSPPAAPDGPTRGTTDESEPNSSLLRELAKLLGWIGIALPLCAAILDHLTGGGAVSVSLASLWWRALLPLVLGSFVPMFWVRYRGRTRAPAVLLLVAWNLVAFAHVAVYSIRNVAIMFFAWQAMAAWALLGRRVGLAVTAAIVLEVVVAAGLTLSGRAPEPVVYSPLVTAVACCLAMIVICGLAAGMRTRTDEEHERQERRQRRLVSMQDQLRHLATTDALTGLPNRRAFFDATPADGERRRHVVLAIDADHFKRVNDTHGHAAGDAVLQAIATRLSLQAREQGALVYRLGGEEFGVIGEVTRDLDARRLAERLLAAVSAVPVRIGDEDAGDVSELAVTVSIGGAIHGCDGSKLQGALRRADEALYRAKAAGRDRVCWAVGGPAAATDVEPGRTGLGTISRGLWRRWRSWARGEAIGGDDAYETSRRRLVVDTAVAMTILAFALPFALSVAQNAFGLHFRTAALGPLWLRGASLAVVAGLVPIGIAKTRRSVTPAVWIMFFATNAMTVAHLFGFGAQAALLHVALFMPGFVWMTLGTRPGIFAASLTIVEVFLASTLEVARGQPLLGPLTVPHPLVVAIFAIFTIWAASRLSAAALRFASDAKVELVAQAAALTKANADLARLAATDELTGLFNRRSFFERAEEWGAARHGPLAIVMFDVDRFKRVNDRWGHVAGDAVLRAVAETLRTLDDMEVFAARIGGEEFALLLRGESGSAPVGIAERLRHKVSQLRPECDGVTLRVTASFGVAMLEGDVSVALRAADDAMYAAKQAGRDRVLMAA